MAQMIEVSGLDLVVGQDYYMEITGRYPYHADFLTYNRSVVRFLSRNPSGLLGDFQVVQHISGENIDATASVQLEPIRTGPPPPNVNFISKFYRKTDTPMNEQRRTDAQRNAALAATHAGLGIHQHTDAYGNPQFSRAPGAGPRSGPNDPRYLPGGGRSTRKRTLRRASTSRKRRSAARSKKRRAKSGKRKNTRRHKRR